MKRFLAIFLALLMAMHIPLTTIASASTENQLISVDDMKINVIRTPEFNLDQNDEDLQEILMDTDEQDINDTNASYSDLLNTKENTTTLKYAAQKGKPSTLSSYTDKDGVVIDWNSSDLKWWFLWDSKIENISSLVWQVSVVKFADDPSNWKNPAGLVASGSLSPDQKEFNIDFAGFSQTSTTWSQEYSKNTTMPYIKNSLQINKSKILTRENQAAYNSLLKKSSQLAIKKTDVLAGINVNNKKELNLKLAELTKNMAKGINATKKKIYYVRVVPLDRQGECLQMPGLQRKITYGEITSASDNDASIVLKTTAYGGQKNEMNQFVVLKDAYLDWNAPRFYLNTGSPDGIKNGLIQVSNTPFSSIYENDWKNPDGLVYQKSLNGLNYNNFILDFTPFAPEKDVKKPMQIHYYVRTIFSNDSQNVYVSNTIRVLYGDMGPSTAVEMQVPIPVYRPVISIKEYQPVHFEQSKACFQYIVVKEPPSMFKSMYKVGDKVDMSPKPEDKDAWDYISDGIGAFIDFAGALLNWASQTMASLQNFAADMIVSLVPGQQAWLKTLVVAGIQAGLVSLGVPPTLPTSDQLMDMGVEYLAETVAQQAHIPGELTSEIAKQGIQAMADQAKTTGSIPGTMDFLKLDPDFQYRNAYLLLDLYNPDPNNSTLPGSMDVIVNDCYTPAEVGWQYGGDSVYKVVSLPIPALAPKQHLQVPVIFEENEGYGNAKVEPEGWKIFYNTGTSEFKVGFYPTLPDPSGKDNPLKYQYINGGPTSYKLQPNKPYINVNKNLILGNEPKMNLIPAK